MAKADAVRFSAAARCLALSVSLVAFNGRSHLLADDGRMI